MPNSRNLRYEGSSSYCTTQHPGEFLDLNYIKKYKLVPNELAKRLAVNPSTLSRLINQEAHLTPEMAIKLSLVLGVDAAGLLYMQVDHDLERASLKLDYAKYHPINLTDTDSA